MSRLAIKFALMCSKSETITAPAWQIRRGFYAGPGPLIAKTANPFRSKRVINLRMDEGEQQKARLVTYRYTDGGDTP